MAEAGMGMAETLCDTAPSVCCLMGVVSEDLPLLFLEGVEIAGNMGKIALRTSRGRRTENRPVSCDMATVCDECAE